MSFDYDKAVAALAARPDVREALTFIDEHKDAIVAEWIRLVEISAPSGQERERAEVFRSILAEAGADSSEYDDKGNLLTWYHGTEGGPLVVLDAHLDTVWKEKMVIKARVEDGKLHAPGAIDDTVALVGLSTVLRAMTAAGIRLKSDLLLAATTYEEVGVLGGKALANRLKGTRTAMYLYVHGGGMRITYGKTMGVRWYKVRFRGPGGHTQFDHENRSAVWAVAEAVTRINQEVSLISEPLSEQQLYNAGMLGAADSYNAKAAEAWFSMDMRSFHEDRLDRMDSQMRAITDEVAARWGFTCEWERDGGHPATWDDTAIHSDRVQWSIAASKVCDVPVELVERMGGGTAWASQAGIPVVGHHITTGVGFHNVKEYGDIEPLFGGLKRLLLVTLAMGGLR